MHFQTGFSKTKARMGRWLQASRAAITRLIKTVLPLHAAAWKASSGPLDEMLRVVDIAEQNKLTKIWCDSTLSQLNTISVTSGLIAAVDTSSFSWPIFSGSGDHPNWTFVMALWYCSLVLAIGSIACATQQAVALNRLRSYSDGLERMRNMLGKLDGNRYAPRRLHVFIWQTPVMLQNGSIYSYVIGLVVLIWKLVAQDYSRDHIIILITFFTATVFIIICYAITSIGVYSRDFSTIL